MLRVEESAFRTLINACAELESHGLDYRVTGVCAANLYGYRLDTNVIDIALTSDEAVYEAVKILGLPENPEYGTYDPYIHSVTGGAGERRGYIRLQGDALGEPVIHPNGIRLHSKGLLLDRLDIYAGVRMGNRIETALSFIALTLDDEKTEKYRHIWNRL
jgi:hypothetical protein